MDEKFDAVDQISELPEFIIHHIMSFLCSKDVAKTSVLSKRWNDLRSSFPILQFHQTEFNKVLFIEDPYFLKETVSPEIQESREKFMTFVDASLQSFSQQRMCMQKFALYINLDLKLASRLDKWVGLAIQNNVKDLTIHLRNKLYEWYHLPETVFATKSITFLDIEGCKLELPSGNPIKFSSLQTLYLETVYIDEDMIQNFVRSCPLIKYFSLSNSWGFKSFRVSELPYLETLNLSPESTEFKEVHVEAPRLKTFDFFSLVDHSCTMDMAVSQDLKQLCIKFFYVTEQLLHNLTSKFPNLEELTLGDCRRLERMAISSNKLKSLSIYGSNKLEVAEIDAPNLLVFKYWGDNMPVLSSTSALCQWYINLSAIKLNSHWFLKFREFLDNLNRKFLNLDIFSWERTMQDMFDLEDLTEKSLPLPYELEHLTLRTGSSNSSALMDGLFWCCHPKIISMESGSGCNNAFIKLLCQKLMDVEVRSCCSSSQIKCWLHYLEDVGIESFEGTSDQGFHDWKTLLDALPTLAEGQKLCFRFNWRSYLV